MSNEGTGLFAGPFALSDTGILPAPPELFLAESVDVNTAFIAL